jgi:hypothetical protein
MIGNQENVYTCNLRIQRGKKEKHLDDLLFKMLKEKCFPKQDQKSSTQNFDFYPLIYNCLFFKGIFHYKAD